MPKRDIYLQSMDTYFHKRTQIFRKGGIICACVRTLNSQTASSNIMSSPAPMEHAFLHDCMIESLLKCPRKIIIKSRLFQPVSEETN